MPLLVPEYELFILYIHIIFNTKYTTIDLNNLYKFLWNKGNIYEIFAVITCKGGLTITVKLVLDKKLDHRVKNGYPK